MKKQTSITVLGLMGWSVFMEVSHFHAPGETISASSLHAEPGGKGCNQAVAAARLGANVDFLSCMGKDAIAGECIAFMEKERVRCHTQFTAMAASAYACILTDSRGENRVTVHRGSADYLSREHVRSCEETIARSDILLLNNECPLETNMTALEIAQKHGVKAILNPAPYTEVPEEYLRGFFLITPNYCEAAALTGVQTEHPPEELCIMLRKRGVERGVITLGAKGAVAWEGEKVFSIAAEKVRVLDTTGAGDCFSAALCVSLASGADIRTAAAFAGHCSALSVTRKHVMTALPFREEAF